MLSFHGETHRETPVDVLVAEPFDFDEEYRAALVEEVARDVRSASRGPRPCSG